MNPRFRLDRKATRNLLRTPAMAQAIRPVADRAAAIARGRYATETHDADDAHGQSMRAVRVVEKKRRDRVVVQVQVPTRGAIFVEFGTVRHPGEHILARSLRDAGLQVEGARRGGQLRRGGSL